MLKKIKYQSKIRMHASKGDALDALLKVIYKIDYKTIIFIEYLFIIFNLYNITNNIESP